jgi:hypothetical protein
VVLNCEFAITGLEAEKDGCAIKQRLRDRV